MKLKLFAIATTILLNTHQAHTMNKFSKWISSWNAPGAQVAPPITPKKIVPLAEFKDATDLDKDMICVFNNLQLAGPKLALLQLFADLEKNVATIGGYDGLSKDNRKKHLKSVVSTLQKPDRGLYEDDHFINFYEGIYPQLVKNKTEKEYFKNRLNKYNKKFNDFDTACRDMEYVEKFRERHESIDWHKANLMLGITIQQTGFEEPIFEELCCCTPEMPMDVLDIIRKDMLYINHSKAHDARKTS
jgi:hypothetical protein